MTIEEVQSQIEQAEEHISRGSYDEAKHRAQQSLADHIIENNPPLKARALLAMTDSLWRLGMAYDALPYAEEALAIALENQYKDIEAKALGSIGAVYKELTDFPRALEYLHNALALSEALGSKNDVAINTSQIGIVYAQISDFPHSLEYFQEALAIAEELDNKISVAANSSNIGNVYRELSDYPRALEFYHKSLALNEALGIKIGVAKNIGNIGNVYQQLLDYPQALEYYHKALLLNEELGFKSGIIANTGNIGRAYGSEDFDGYHPEKAEEYLLRATLLSEELGEKHNLYENHRMLANLYKGQERWKESDYHFRKFHQIEKEVQNAAAKRKAEQLNYERKQVEREKQIAVERAKHEATEQLLYNVLPPTIASRMLSGEQLIAEKLESVSVLFADIAGFTQLSANISAEDLVATLDRIFSAFDTLAEKHGLEKIKTIGDAYMVVAGAPESRDDHAEAMAMMAIEMQNVMEEFRSIATDSEIQIRIGIHTGDVVAGVIGKKKFAYDLWGDTVNTASRMESHGETGKIHVSEEFKNAVGTGRDLSLPERDLSLQDVHFIERGEMDIKGKGIMKTYFLEKA